MDRCIKSLLYSIDESVEILIVDDGSTDNTFEIAGQYKEKYPKIITIIHQENKGHGGAINTGIKYASGMYLKVVDSDDWVDNTAYEKILDKLKCFYNDCDRIDMMISNYVYEKIGKKHKKIIKYGNVFPEGKVFSWNDIKKFRLGQYLLMHSVIFRTKLLRDCGLKLPKHTFYVDNLFVYYPLSSVKTMYYINVDFYRYFIGSQEQSVNEKVMIKRIDQQIHVNKMMVDCKHLKTVGNSKLQQYLFHFLEIVTLVSSILLIRSNNNENLKKMNELWNYINERNNYFYKKLRKGLPGKIMSLPGRIGRFISVCLYKISRSTVGFN